MEMYVKPEVELIQYDLRDVISTSGGEDCDIYHEWCHSEGSYSCPFADRP